MENISKPASADNKIRTVGTKPAQNNSIHLLTLKHLIVFVITGILPLSIYAQENTDGKILNPKYSIQNRWNIKANYSIYNTSASFLFSEKTNIRLELNYGFNSCLEVGIYGGIQTFFTSKTVEGVLTPKTGTAPTFGAQVNFHLLPLFVQNPNSRWELYLTAKYGGVIFIHRETKGITADGTPFYFPKANEYKHEYCMGVGGGVYFWKVFGLYAELGLGEFNRVNRPINNLVDKLGHFKLRGGFTFKF